MSDKLHRVGYERHYRITRGSSSAVSPCLRRGSRGLGTSPARRRAGIRGRRSRGRTKKTKLRERIRGGFSRYRSAAAKSTQSDLAGFVENYVLSSRRATRLTSPLPSSPSSPPGARDATDPVQTRDALRKPKFEVADDWLPGSRHLTPARPHPGYQINRSASRIHNNSALVLLVIRARFFF